MMAVRTIVIDEAAREAASPQVVILGAGLDGRAWRMPELKDALVYEVDHPDTQREKRARVGSLTQRAREVKFAPVDFTRDDLGERLAAAGHDPARRTTWIWEGVVMYLTPAEIEATLRVVAARSAPGSRLAIVYVGPGGWIAPIVALAVPLASSARRDARAARAARLRRAHGRDPPDVRGAHRARRRESLRRVKHVRIAIAVRR